MDLWDYEKHLDSMCHVNYIDYSPDTEWEKVNGLYISKPQW